MGANESAMGANESTEVISMWETVEKMPDTNIPL